MFKRRYCGTCYCMGAKHGDRHMSDLMDSDNLGDQDTLGQMNAVVAGQVGKRLW